MPAQQPEREQKQEFAFLPEQPRPPRSLSGAYLASWAVLGCLSATYIAVVLSHPEWAPPLTTQSLPSEQPPPIPAVVQQLTDEIGSLRQSVSDLQRELDEVKSAAAPQEEPQAPLRGSSQDMELAMLQPEPAATAAPPQIEPQANERESAPATAEPKLLEPPTPVAARPVPPEPPKQKPAKPAQAPAKASQPEPEAVSADRKPREDIAKPERNAVKKVVVLNAKPVEELKEAAPIETGSLRTAEPPVITFGPAIVTPAAQPVSIHLDAAPSLDALRLKWSVLHDRHRSALGELRPRFVVTGTGSSPSYLLMAGPIATPDEASRICALLRARSVPCSVGGSFTGQAL